MPPTPSAILRQILSPSTIKPLYKSHNLFLLSRPCLQTPQTFQQSSHLRPRLLQNAFAANVRTFSTSPSEQARVTEFAKGFRSIETNAWRDELLKEKAFMREEQRRKEKDRLRDEKCRKHEECMRQMHACKSRVRQYLLRVYRRHFRFSSHRSRSSSWRPARLCFRTPNLSDVFRSRHCGDYTGKSSKLCPKLLYALFDERRRYHPQRAAHFRHLVKIVQSEVAIHYARGTKGGCVGDLNTFHARWCPKRNLRERFERELGAGSHGAGGGENCYKGTYKGRFRKHKHQHQTKDHDGNFDYSTFRKAYWYSRTHSHSRPYNHHREWTRRKQRMMWTRPQEWVMKKDGVMRRRTGSAFITWDQCSQSKSRKVHGVHGRGGNGGISSRYEVKVNSVRLETPRSLRQTSSRNPSSLHSHSTRPRLSLPISSPPSLFSQARAFSSSRPRYGLHFIVPIAAALKSTEALHLLVWITRLSLTLLPLSVRAKAIFALRERYLRDPSSLTATIWSRLASTYYSGSLAQPSGLLSRFNALWGLPLLLISPFILLALVGFASLERTPVTGRWRFVMLSPAEESELVDGILDIGRIASPATTSHANNGDITPVAPEGTSLDWVTILRQVLSLPDEGVDPVTGRRMLLGGVVLDQRDWRVRWSEAVLRALEKGVVEGLTKDGAGARGEGEALRPLPSKWPLEGRSMEQSSWKEELILSKHLDGHGSVERKDGLKVEYDILVIDRDENNAFSFGFGPEKQSHQESGRRGVIVLYTGFLKEVLGETMQPSPTTSSSPQPSPTRRTSFFSRPSNVPPSTPEPDPIASYLVPSTLPTQEQCKSLAVLLSHETAHLILSHTLESYASMNLLMPHLSRLASDVLRTLLYPLTAILGPFINDAVGRSLSEGAKGGFGLLGSAANSCESRKLESEADLVALRLLAGSGIDPRFALDFWEDRLSTSPTSSSTSPATPLPNSIHQHSKASTESSMGMLDGYMRTHPVDRERLDKIREELESWEEWNRQNKTEATVA